MQKEFKGFKFGLGCRSPVCLKYDSIRCILLLVFCNLADWKKKFYLLF